MTHCIALPRQLAYERQQGCCYYCGMPMWLRSADEILSRFDLTERQAKLLRCTAEHLLARCDGGDDAQSNIAAACHYCNRGRHARKRPLSPEKYSNLVRSRVMRRGWHSDSLLKLLPAPHFPVRTTIGRHSCVPLSEITQDSEEFPAGTAQSTVIAR